VVVLSDEIYEKLIFDGHKHYSIATLDSQLAKRTVVVNGMSKAYSMTGWRLGYAACPNKELAQAVGSIQSHSTSNATSFAQSGGIAALEKGEEDARKMCGVFEKRRDLFIQKLSGIAQLKPFVPQGAFYVFANISKSGLGSVEVAERLLSEALVAAVPGKPFGNDQYIRMSFATSDQNLEEAARRLSDWFKKL
jgi:aspartate aminotransferase